LYQNLSGTEFMMLLHETGTNGLGKKKNA